MSFLLNAAIKGVLEGLTEFLPISSTAHLVLVRKFFPLTGDTNPVNIERLDNVFDIVIQFPAILAIVILYWSRLWSSVRTIPERPESQRFWTGLVFAFFPAAVFGVLFHKKIEDHLMHPTPIAIAMIAGGLVLLIIDRVSIRLAATKAEQIPISTAFVIGFYQCLGMIPGTSRSGATIVGGRLSGLNRPVAAEFSFFLALPTMLGATVYKLVKEYNQFNWNADAPVLIVGGIASFVSAWIVVALFIRFLQKHSLAVFGWYRIILGVAVLMLAKQLAV